MSSDTHKWLETCHVHSQRLNIHLTLSTIFGNPSFRSLEFPMPFIDWFICFNSFSKFGTCQTECSHVFGKRNLLKLHVSTHL